MTANTESTSSFRLVLQLMSAAAPSLNKTAGDPNPWEATPSVDAISQLPLKFFSHRENIATSMEVYVSQEPVACTASVAMAYAVPHRNLRMFGRDSK